MPNFYRKRIFRYPIYTLVGVTAFLIGIIGYFQWIFGVIGFVILGVILYFLLRAEMLMRHELEQYVATLSHRVKKVGEEALMEMPIGIILYNEEFQVEWANPYMTAFFKEETVIGHSLQDFAESFIPIIKQEIEADTVTIHSRKLKILNKREERLIYLTDITEQSEIEKKYEDERTVLGVIFLDNYDEVTQGMDDQVKSNINSQVTSILNKWATDNGVYLKRTSSERLLAVFNEQILHQLEKNKFDILDQVRESTSKQSIPLTLSIGIGIGSSLLPELGSLAQSGLDLALGRGGDQVAIKQQNGKVKFFGGKTNPMEKRTRVRARVISHALRELVIESDKVIIMGHKYPDMDAIGASIGILKVAQANQREGFIVIDKDELDTGVQRLIHEIKQYPELWSRFITPEQALEIASDDTLLVVVDTHKPSLVIEERLLSRLERVVVIDHHRRGEEFIYNPLLVYMEPYASSTAELVTELLEYQPKRSKLDMLESTALLAGIIVDTKSFTLRTGSRTFDAASYLRAHGADTILVQKFLKEDIDVYVKRSKIVESTYLYKNGIAIAKGEETERYEQILIAQSADALLSMSGVTASFAIAHRQDGIIGISARSLGEFNVQVIMEALGGGGHLTNAATQITEATIEEAEEMLKGAIDEYFEGRNES
ncbi:DHH family phosphoesterase [Bacillus suaedaesalsae]|uniref:Cyclic-di-AMP phosphodiesterase n=1 Tax=Bacillus suaedaesalsae TaxID=2810349 RepID=A0ABS2DEN4_9BACI|nr:DHH family phosphoesterase [Bacillus suaedaesalsae]MBM6616915.1 DHH family phosphoesterase [Bacillus suaedaesalsae]